MRRPKDGANACTAEEVITSEVKTSFDQYPELANPNAIRVQTHNQAVYLYGNVATGLQRDEAISLARRVPHVKRVISSISTGNSGGYPRDCAYGWCRASTARSRQVFRTCKPSIPLSLSVLQ